MLRANRNLDSHRWFRIIAYDNNALGSLWFSGWDQTGSATGSPNTLFYMLGETLYDYSSNIICLISDHPLHYLTVTDISVDVMWNTDELYWLEQVIVFGTTQDSTIVSALNTVRPPALQWLEFQSTQIITPPLVTGYPLLYGLVLSNNENMTSPPIFTGATLPLLVTLDLQGCFNASLSAAKMDLMYQQLDALTINGGPKALYGNGRYTAASLTARNSLVAKGWSIVL